MTNVNKKYYQSMNAIHLHPMKKSKFYTKTSSEMDDDSQIDIF
jgi:hypothetical protein